MKIVILKNRGPKKFIRPVQIEHLLIGRSQVKIVVFTGFLRRKEVHKLSKKRC